MPRNAKVSALVSPRKYNLNSAFLAAYLGVTKLPLFNNISQTSEKVNILNQLLQESGN
jgi:hypothetical protein